MANSDRIETVTRPFANLILTSAQITRLVQKQFGEAVRVYPSDSAFASVDGKVVPRTSTQQGAADSNDGVLLYLGNDRYQVLPTDKIYRKPGTGRGRNARAKQSPEQLDAALDAMLVKAKRL